MSKGVQSWSGIGAARILAGRSGRHGCNQVLCSYFYTINRNWNTQLKNRMRLLMDGKFLRVLPPISMYVISLYSATDKAAPLLSCLASALMLLLGVHVNGAVMILLVPSFLGQSIYTETTSPVGLATQYGL
nr:uncharacterized protein LOC104100489 isoform X1 [Nicotiana tomentosiformis]